MYGLKPNHGVEDLTGFGLYFHHLDDFFASSVPELILYFGSTEDTMFSNWKLPLTNYFVPILHR